MDLQPALSLRKRDPMIGAVQGTILASNLESRLTASKYKRSPAALLWRPQEPPPLVASEIVSNLYLDRVTDRTSQRGG